MTLSRAHLRLVDAAAAIRLDPDKTEAAFMARQLVQATLPHKNPGDVPLWSRTNGDLTLTIQPGQERGKLLGYPFGTIPRLLLFWITTEALRTGSPRLELGNTLAAFMRELGLDPSRGGKRSDAKRLREQMERLFRARISFDQMQEGRKSWLDMQVAPKGMLWWDDKQPHQGALWNSWIHLGEDFYQAITVAPVPVDMRALRALKRSPLALDLYAWATFAAFQTQRSGHVRSVSWELLHEQFGAEYAEMKEFARKSWTALQKVQAVYPELGIERIPGGVQVLPCNPHVTVKPKSRA
jgi:hypothetical protein